MPLDSSSLERLVPDRIEAGGATGRETLELHLARYEFAARHARPGRLLDCACGVGYGTRLLSERRRDVTALGVDIVPGVVEYAQGRYADGRTTFLCADGAQLSDPDGFDTIVSLETIEHLPEPERFLGHLVGLLAPGGVLVASVPTTPSVDVNPHHLHDFTARSFRRMVERHGLRAVDTLEQVQRVNPVSVVRRSESRMQDARENLGGYYFSHPGALARRLWSTLRHGFTNRYLTVAWRKDDGGSP